MTKNFYLTGDRGMDPMMAVQVAGKTLALLAFENKGEPMTFTTGDAPTGVEAAVRYLLPPQALTVIERGKTPEGYIDFDTTHAKLAETIDQAIVLHGDPLGSRIGASVTKTFPEDKVRFLLQEQTG